MRQTKKRKRCFISALMCWAALMAAFPATVSWASLDESAADEIDLSESLTLGNVSIDTNGDYLIYDVTTANSITIKENVECNLKIDSLTIDNVDSAPAIWVMPGATLNLEVSGDNSLQGAAGFAGICAEPEYNDDWTLNAENSAKLNISGDGTLTAKGGDGKGSDCGGAAGIGGNGQHANEVDGRNDVDFGVVTVSSDFIGTINVTGGEAASAFGGGAGIGSGGFNMADYNWGTVQGQIFLSGGNVNANPGSENKAVGAGIGGGAGQGYDTAESDIIINISGGEITSQGGILSAGIGGGGICDGGYISISGGIVIAQAGERDNSLGAAGIGGGNDGSVRSVEITGGIVEATADGGAAGIGGGAETQLSNIHYGDTDGIVSEDKKGRISISGPGTRVTAQGGTGEGGSGKLYGGSGIGSGYMSVAANRSTALDISIGFGAEVTAYGGYHAQAIGYGYHPNSEDERYDSSKGAYTGYGITLELDDSITLWAVNDDYHKPALVQATIYDEQNQAQQIVYGDVSYLSDAIYLTAYTGDETHLSPASGSLQAGKKTAEGYSKDAIINWEFYGTDPKMHMEFAEPDIETLSNELDTPFTELHGNWATLYPAPVSVTYEFVGEAPESAAAPAAEFIVSGTSYTSALQEEVEGYKFFGWYTDSECTQEYADGTILYKNTVLYGKWVSDEPDETPIPTRRPSGGGGSFGPAATATPVPTQTPDSSGGTGAPELNYDDHYAYVIGYPDGSVRPNGRITRGEVATIFFRLLSDESRDGCWSKSNEYGDVSSSDWYNNPISTITNAGIVNGYPDGSFAPDVSITRAEFAAIAARFDSGLYEGEDRFNDISGHWANEYINRAAVRGWVNGYGDGGFRPDQPITRAEAMTLINNVLDRRPESADALNANMNIWSDNLDANAWYYLAVQEATNSHYWEHADNDHEKWTDMRENRDWLAFER